MNLADPLRYSYDKTEFIPKNEKCSFISGKNNSIQIQDQAGFKYNQDSREPNKKGEVRWTCSKRSSRKCRVVIKTLGEIIISQKTNHTCYDY